MPEFSGGVALVTGATSGIGRAIACALARRGAAVWAVGRQRKALDDLAPQLEPAGRSYVADLSGDIQIRELATAFGGKSSRLDILVHSAGTIELAAFDAASVEEFDKQYRLNLRVPFLLTQCFLPQLRASRGQIVFINSNAALQPGVGAAQYAASKAGLRGLAKALRQEVNRDGIRVLEVFVGRTATPMQQSIHQREGKAYRPDALMQPDDVASAVCGALALPRSTEVTEIRMRPMLAL